MKNQENLSQVEQDINETIFEKKLYHHKISNSFVNFLVKHKIMTKENANESVEAFKYNFEVFSLWISGLSWGKFIFFIILFNMVSHMFLNQMGEGFLYKLFDSVTSLFIFGAIGIKIFLKSKMKSQAQIKEAQLLTEKETLQRQLAEAKVQIMQAQIEPHFLFNTLSSLDYLILTDKAKASKMLLSLVTYLRYALPQIRENQSFSTLGKEIENIKAYLSIMEIRMGDRLRVEYYIDDSLKNIPFPSMTLQPIVENAIKYGIEESVDDGMITISAHHNADILEICVCDTGPGLEHSQNAHKKGNGISLKNIKERLAMLYDNLANITIMNHAPKGVIVKIAIPLHTPAKQATKPQLSLEK